MSNRNSKYQIQKSKIQILKFKYQKTNFEKQLLKIEQGFTLIEVMVAVAILAICIVTIMQLFSGGLRSSKMAKDYTRAVIYAKEKMEETLLKPVAGAGEFNDDLNKNKFRWEAEVSPYNELSLAGLGSETKPLNLTKIKVKVSWADNDKQKSIELTTLKINPEESNF